MERLEEAPAPTRLERVTLVAGILLLAALTLLPWHSGGPAPTAGGASGRTAIQAPNAAYGIGAALAVTVAVAWLATATLVPRPPLPYPGRALVLLVLVALALVIVKLAVDVEDVAVGAWASLLFGLVTAASAAASRLSR